MFDQSNTSNRQYEAYQNFHFHIIDYFIFVGMLVFSAGTGLYYGYYSYVSGVTVLGTPAEIYNFGTQYWLTVIPVVLMALTVSTVYLPVFTNLKVSSSYEYLELRFSSGIRSFASFLFIIDEILFLPIILYVPAIAFNQVTGVNIHLLSAIVCIVCVFYTLLGGIKAVVTTDAWQIMVMYLSVVVIVILGTVYIGGPGVVFDRSYEGGRIIFDNFSPSPYERHSMWGVVVGGYLYWVSFNSVNQTMVQRYISLPTTRKSQTAVWLFATGICFFISTCCYAGVLIFAYYHKCDPATAGLIKADDQLFPMYVMQVAGHLPGIPGLFIAGIFGACLSSLSVVLNCSSAVLLEDIVRNCFKITLSEKAATILVKSSVVVLGIIALMLVIVLEKLGGILAVATSLSSIAAGTSCGIFTLGMLIPWSNTKGATVGAVAGFLTSATVSLGSQLATAQGNLYPKKLPVWFDQCPANWNVTAIPPPPDQSDVFPLFRISFLWVCPIGLLTVIIIGSIASLLFGVTPLKELDADLISPVIHRFLPKECFLPRSSESNISLT